MATLRDSLGGASPRPNLLRELSEQAILETIFREGPITRPEIERPFRVPLVWFVAPLGAAACIYTMFGLPTAAWERFGIWLAVGIAIYVVQKLSARPTAA